MVSCGENIGYIGIPLPPLAGPEVASHHMPCSSRTPSALNRATKQSGEIRRKVFLAEFDPDKGNPIPTATAHLKLTPEQCTVVDISQLSKEYLNIEDDLVTVDENGFEILDNSTTRGRNVIIISRNCGVKSYLVCC